MPKAFKSLITACGCGCVMKGWEGSWLLIPALARSSLIPLWLCLGHSLLGCSHQKVPAGTNLGEESDDYLCLNQCSLLGSFWLAQPSPSGCCFCNLHQGGAEFTQASGQGKKTRVW